MLPPVPYAATIGTFDGVHLGHRAVLKQLVDIAREHDFPARVITFDRHPLADIRPADVPPLITSPSLRNSLLENVPGIDSVEVIPFTPKLRALTAREFLRILHDIYNVRLLVMGHDNSFGSDRLRSLDEYIQAGADLGIRIVGADMVSLPDRDDVLCSSSVRRAVRESDISRANAMLGRPFELSGKVVRGKQIGRLIGFPTANIVAEPGLLIPGPGVYACMALLPDGTRVPAMVNIGRNPTVSNDQTLSVEAHLVDWNGDLYGQCITLQFLEFIRHEECFPSLQALAKALKADRKRILSIVKSRS